MRCKSKYNYKQIIINHTVKPQLSANTMSSSEVVCVYGNTFGVYFLFTLMNILYVTLLSYDFYVCIVTNTFIISYLIF